MATRRPRHSSIGPVTPASSSRWSGPKDPYPTYELGTIKEGAWADLLLWDANPLDDIKVILDEENLRQVAARLRKGAVRLKQRSFENSLAAAQPRDFVYLDPPYSPTNSVARFTGYTADGFGPHDQEKLQHEVLRLARQGTGILLSNSVTPETDRLYRDDAHIAAAGLTVRTTPARRSINSDGAKRTGSEDYIVTNMTPAEDGNK